MIDCLDLIEEAMAIKEDFSTYAWAYGNLTGVLAKHYNNKFPTEENIMKFLDRLMQINKFCFQFPKVKCTTQWFLTKFHSYKFDKLMHSVLTR